METRDSYFNALQKQAVADPVLVTSTVPVVGPLIVRTRNSWNTLLAKLRLVRRQDLVNSKLVDEIRQQAIRTDQETEVLAQLDRELTSSRRESAILAAQNRQLQEQIHAIEARIARLEQQIGKLG